MQHLSRSFARLSRRRFLALLGAAALDLGLAGCGQRQAAPPTATTATAAPPAGPADGRLRSRPGGATPAAVAPGLQPLGLAKERDGHVYVPAGYRPDVPTPTVLLFHGYTGNSLRGIELLRDHADEAGLLLVAVNARKVTWDVIIDDEYGPDVAFIDAALALVFARYAIDPARLVIGGFSDGASYALSLGLINGDLFSHIIAFSPGSISHGERAGQPPIFIAHGVNDDVLPIESCSRVIVPALQLAGYQVAYEEFEGGHTVPAAIAADAVAWLCANPHC